MKNKFLCVLLTLILIIGLVPASVFANDPPAGLSFTIDPPKAGEGTLSAGSVVITNNDNDSDIIVVGDQWAESLEKSKNLQWFEGEFEEGSTYWGSALIVPLSGEFESANIPVTVRGANGETAAEKALTDYGELKIWFSVTLDSPEDEANVIDTISLSFTAPQAGEILGKPDVKSNDLAVSIEDAMFLDEDDEPVAMYEEEDFGVLYVRLKAARGFVFSKDGQGIYDPTVLVNGKEADCDFDEFRETLEVYIPFELREGAYLYIGDTAVTDDNLEDGGWSYDPQTKTLTIKGFSFFGEGHTIARKQSGALIRPIDDPDQGNQTILPEEYELVQAGIFAPDDLTIKLDGNLILNIETSKGAPILVGDPDDISHGQDAHAATDNEFVSTLFGIMCGGKLTFTGEGNLIVNMGEAMMAIGGITAKDGVVFAKEFSGKAEVNVPGAYLATGIAPGFDINTVLEQMRGKTNSGNASPLGMGMVLSLITTNTEGYVDVLGGEVTVCTGREDASGILSGIFAPGGVTVGNGADLKAAVITNEEEGEEGIAFAILMVNPLTAELQFAEMDEKELIAKYDTNGNGEVDEDEFLAAMTHGTLETEGSAKMIASGMIAVVGELKAPGDAVVKTGLKTDGTDAEVSEKNVIPFEELSYNFGEDTDAYKYISVEGKESEDSEVTTGPAIKPNDNISHTRPTHSITPSEAEGGKVKLSKSSAKSGDSVTVTLVPDEGMEAAGIVVKNAAGKVFV